MSNKKSITPKGNQPNVIESDARQIRVNAGAGTGKTTTMVWRIEQLIEEDGISPEQILVLTFANKAAHSNQNDLADIVSEKRGYDVDSYTYHSFCHRLLKEYAYQTGLSPDFELVTDDRRQSLIQQIAVEQDYRFIEPATPGSGGDTANLAEDLNDFIGIMKHEGHTPTDLEDMCPSPETIERLRNIVDEIKRQADIEFDCNRNVDLKFSPENFNDNFSRFDDFISQQQSRLESSNPIEANVHTYLDNLKDVLGNMVKEFDRSIDDLFCFLPSAIFTGHIPGTFGDTEQTPIERLEAYVQIWQYVYDFTKGYQRYEDRLKKEGALDYADLISTTVELLDSKYGKEILDQWDAVYCDEFQDTDRRQMELIKRLSQDNELLVIGDTDQSIYEWRGAHPENLDNFHEQPEFKGTETITLRQNYRSRQGILDLANNLPGSTKDLEAYRDDINASVLKIDGNPDPDQQAEQVATTISKTITGNFDKLNEKRDLDEDSLAVLVRRNRDAQCIARHLDKKGIPYELAGGLGETAPGIETVLAYFRVLVDRFDEVSLNRVLQMVYRVTGEDLRILNKSSDTLWSGLQTPPLPELEHPNRVKRAANDLAELRAARKTHSISELYEVFRNKTKITWYLTEDERKELSTLENIIETFDDDPIETELSKSFIQYLELQSSISRETSEGREDVAEKTHGKVNIMTIHKAKGLEFDIVYLPYLSDSWPVLPSLTTDYRRGKAGRGVFDTLSDMAADSEINPLFDDLSDQQVREAWRALHVAITRGRDRVFCFGHELEEPNIGSDRVQEFIPNEIKWSVHGPDFPIWERVSSEIENLDEVDMMDITSEIDSDKNATRGTIQWYNGKSVDVKEALSEVEDLARNLRQRTLDKVDPATVGFQNESLGSNLERDIVREHSHTSLETYRKCPRQHYLDHVIQSFDDPIDLTSAVSSDNFVPQRDIGTLFHEVAEEAFWRDYTTEAQWQTATDRIGRQLGLEHAIDDAKACVDRYFQTEFKTATKIGAEIPFELEKYSQNAPGTIQGYIDGIYELVPNDPVIMDYKTIKEQKELDESFQLLIYLQAAQQLDRLPDISKAGYIYVGESGPDYHIFTYDELKKLNPKIEQNINQAEKNTYGSDPLSGSHCQYCTHWSLGCADGDYTFNYTSSQ